MSKKKLNECIIHCHFNGEPSNELIEALNRLAEVAAKTVGKEINNGDTEKRGSKSICPLCKKPKMKDSAMCEDCWLLYDHG